MKQLTNMHIVSDIKAINWFTKDRFLEQVRAPLSSLTSLTVQCISSKFTYNTIEQLFLHWPIIYPNLQFLCIGGRDEYYNNHIQINMLTTKFRGITPSPLQFRTCNGFWCLSNHTFLFGL